jgi:predicted amidophosphoribosyltransferase
VNRTPEQLAAIAEYNRGITRSRNQYQAMPTAFRHAGPTCRTCHERTNNLKGVCTSCRKKAKEVVPDDS